MLFLQLISAPKLKHEKKQHHITQKWLFQLLQETNKPDYVPFF